MSTTVTYKGSTLTTISDATKTLKTAGKYMEGDVIITDATTYTAGFSSESEEGTYTIQIGSGSRIIMVNGAKYQFNAGDTIIVRVVDGNRIFYNNVKVKQGDGGTVSYTFSAPAKDIAIRGTGLSGDLYIEEVESGGANIHNQDKSVTPRESEQSITADYGYTGLGTVTVGAISSRYVGSGISRQDSTDVVVSGATVFVPAGYYSAAASKTVASGSATAPASISGTAASVSIGTNTLTLTKTVSVTPTVSAGYISTGTAGNSSVSLTANVTVNPTPTASGATVTIPAGYYTEQTTKSVSSGSAIGPTSLSGSSATVSTGTNTLTLTKTGVTTTPTVSAGYVSSATASTATVTLTASVTTKAAATITPTTTNQTIAAGTYITGTQTIAGDADLVASNIISTANIFGVQGSVVVQNYYTGSSTPTSSLGQNGDIYLQE